MIVGVTEGVTGVGVLAGIVGGSFFDFIKAERFLTDLGVKSKAMGDASRDVSSSGSAEYEKLEWKQRRAFAKAEVKEIFGRIWKWVLIGIAVGALFHGLVPQSWVENHLAAGQWWTVPIASLIGIKKPVILF